MKRLYEKNRLAFSLLWVGVYVVMFSLADNFSALVGIEKVITAPLSLVMVGFLLFWLHWEDLFETYGLSGKKVRGGPYLYFLPLVILASVNLWGGICLRFSPLETVLYVLSMMGVGFLEELIFRGFLFKALCKENVKWAVVVSSLTFGIGHVVNLLNGADMLPTLLQICYATAGGFLFTIIFYRSGTLIPCILAHGVLNSLSAFGAKMDPVLDMVTAGVLTILSVLYGVWLLVKTKENVSGNTTELLP